MKNCKYCGKKIEDNKIYCCGLHEIYDNGNLEKINKLTPQEILNDILICKLKAIDSIRFKKLLSIMLKNEDVINTFLKSELISMLYTSEIVYLFNNLSETQTKILSKSLICQLNDRLISNIESIEKENIIKNKDQFELLMLTLKLII